jgi:hypothetical protein
LGALAASDWAGIQDHDGFGFSSKQVGSRQPGDSGSYDAYMGAYIFSEAGAIGYGVVTIRVLRDN